MSTIGLSTVNRNWESNVVKLVRSLGMDNVLICDTPNRRSCVKLATSKLKDLDSTTWSEMLWNDRRNMDMVTSSEHIEHIRVHWKLNVSENK